MAIPTSSRSTAIDARQMPDRKYAFAQIVLLIAVVLLHLFTALTKLLQKLVTPHSTIIITDVFCIKSAKSSTNKDSHLSMLFNTQQVKLASSMDLLIS